MKGILYQKLFQYIDDFENPKEGFDALEEIKDDLKCAIELLEDSKRKNALKHLKSLFYKMYN